MYANSLEASWVLWRCLVQHNVSVTVADLSSMLGNDYGNVIASREVVASGIWCTLRLQYNVNILGGILLDNICRLQ